MEALRGIRGRNVIRKLRQNARETERAAGFCGALAEEAAPAEEITEAAEEPAETAVAEDMPAEAAAAEAAPAEEETEELTAWEEPEPISGVPSMTVASGPTVTPEKASYYCYEGETVDISVKAEGEGYLGYQWQERVSSLSGWQDVDLPGSDEDTLHVTMSRALLSGKVLLSVITDKNGNSVTTNTVTLSMK